MCQLIEEMTNVSGDSANTCVDINLGQYFHNISSEMWDTKQTTGKVQRYWTLLSGSV